MLAAFVLGLALTSPAVEAPPVADCILDLEAIRGQLDHSARGVTTVTRPTRVERRLEEAIRTSDGTLIEFTTGGCVHYGFSFTYRSVSLQDRGFDAAAARARALLERTPVQADAAGSITLLRDALGSPLDTPAAPGETYLGCGDAVCRLLVSPDDAGGTVTLVVSYDFPL